MPDLHSGKCMTCQAAGQGGMMKGLITSTSCHQTSH